MLERLDLDDSLIPNQHLAVPGSSELSYTSVLASAPERMMLLTTQGDPATRHHAFLRPLTPRCLVTNNTSHLVITWLGS